ncbi:MAG: AAA family ATPase [Alphaproteobacteria bacterium]|nr:AAA family ATPase [Alphaproteobacteria bacterium]
MPSYLKESLRQALEAMAERDQSRPDSLGDGDPATEDVPAGGRPAESPSTYTGASSIFSRPASTGASGGGRAASVNTERSRPDPVRADSLHSDYSRSDANRSDPNVMDSRVNTPPPEEARTPPPAAARASVSVGGTPAPPPSPVRHRLRQADPDEFSVQPDRPAINLPTSVHFRPVEPKSLEEAGLDPEFVKALIVKYLLDFPRSTGRQISAALALNQRGLNDLFHQLRERKFVVAPGSTATGDFRYELSEAGRNYALDLRKVSRYVAPAPVPFEQYLLSVHEQSISRETPRINDLRRAFADLLVSERLLQQLGPAMTSGKGLFLFGPPGNGKTSMAERITRAFGTAVFLPYAILVDGTIMKIFDPMVHEPLEETRHHHQRLDERWVKCRRPTVVAGGELTMDSLEIDYNERTGICEAPIQVKANCGTLVIDDFGRQRIDPATLLNRWIVPLEDRVDYLSLPDGRKVRFPFDPLLIFSTNLDPRDLCDEAFLRRIPYKVNVEDPDENAFRILLDHQATALGFEPDAGVFDYLIHTHFRKPGRSFRNCHPRDLLLQVQNQCIFREQPLKLTRTAIDEAVELYFTLL